MPDMRFRHLTRTLRKGAACFVLPVLLSGFAAPAQEVSAQESSTSGVPTEAERFSAEVSRRPTNRNWKLDDFRDDLATLEGSRSFERGRLAFDAALCAVCHRIGEHGGDLGPDLAKPQKPRTRGELLREILEPSRDIEPKYRTYAVTTTQGNVIAGLIVEKTDRQVTVRTRPVGDGARQTIPRAEIDSIEELDLSMMPDELMGRLTKDEVLDLLAYVESQGDPQSPLFKRP